MKAAKRKRLEAAGWHVGTSADFLELSDAEQSYIDMKLALGDALKATRATRRLSQTDVAALVASSQSRVAKMEAADASVSLDLLVRTLLTLGVPRRRVARMLGG
ncbi:MAG: helix-turn-helix transcriptional regulator [Pseudomonadales bacterium]|nr:helix-turn-helix transcriptional regulator [Pseudomonadales bacterium]MCP5184777.1 helix-turn-helix transcriptional regulator [Pseudomonadales bacterium]